ncbi:MAG: MFS transporter [Provencibacterium sp.]|jgi:sugar phosphate permease|nr:MFS transporter [Provencibacterium sp.]
MREDLQAAKKRLLWLCTAAYTVAYFCRTNLSLALDDLIAGLSISKSSAGLIGTVFFWTYALGQLLCGWLGSRYSLKRLIMVGFLLSGVSNLGIAFSSRYLPVLLCWMMNGLALSLMWPSIVGMVSRWFSPEEYGKVFIYLNLPTTVGYLISWGTLGPIGRRFGWRPVFWIPALVAVLFTALWICMAKDSPEEAGFQADFARPEEGTEEPAAERRLPLWRVLCTWTMLVFAVLTLIQGSTRESLNLWAPSMLTETGAGLPDWMLSGGIMLVQVFSTAGLLATGGLLRRRQSGFDSLFIFLLAFGAACSWILALCHENFFLSLTMMGLMLGVLYGTSGTLTTMVPLRFAATGHSTAVTGILNFMAYLGAAIGGVLSGFVSGRWGWERVYLLWAALGMLALIIMLLSSFFTYQQQRRPDR